MNGLVTIEYIVPAGYREGDYAKLHGNGGVGSIDWNNPLSEEVFDLFPNGAGLFGFGLAPFGHHRFGHAHSMRAAGFGRLPFGHHPFGHGTATITATYEVEDCGDYKFGFACYDELGNAHEGSPEETELEIHLAPAAPTGLKKNSYDKDTDVLVLDAVA